MANPESTNPNAISVGKLRRMYAIKTECGLTDEEAKAIVHTVGECESSKELDWRKYDAVIEAIQAKGAEKRGAVAKADEISLNSDTREYSQDPGSAGTRACTEDDDLPF